MCITDKSTIEMVSISRETHTSMSILKEKKKKLRGKEKLLLSIFTHPQTHTEKTVPNNGNNLIAKLKMSQFYE